MNSITYIAFWAYFIGYTIFLVWLWKTSDESFVDCIGCYTIFIYLAFTFGLLGMEVLPEVFNMPPSSNIIMMCCVFLAIFFGAVAPVLHKYFIAGHFWDIGIIGFIWAILWFTLLAAFLLTSMSVLWVHFNSSATEAVQKGADLSLNTTVFLFLGSFITMFPELVGSKFHEKP